jgi:WD40 repeat protein
LSGQIIAAGTDTGVLSWDVRRPEGVFRHVNLHRDEVSSLEFHPSADATFVSGDEDGNICVFDLNVPDDEDAQRFYVADDSPVFQCGFTGASLEEVFSLRRTAGIRIWNLSDYENYIEYEDLRGDGLFGYPCNAHSYRDCTLVVGGDADGGICVVAAGTEVSVVEKMEKIHADCVNCSWLMSYGDSSLWFFGGDGGQLSFWEMM